MALINTLRNKFGKIVVAAVAISILAFVLADLLGPNSTLLGGNNTSVGEIAGQEIDQKDYNYRVELLKARYGNPGESQMAFVRNAAWDGLISDIAFKNEFEALGLDVSNEELVDMVQGRNIDPSIRQQFSDPTTGEFDVERVIATLNQIGSLPAEQRLQWESYERDLKLGRLRVKYDNLFGLTNYVTKDEAKAFYEEQTATAEVNYLYVPFYTVNDSLANPTDAQLQAYLNAHAEDYQVEEGRSLSYVSFDIQPSGEDSVEFNANMDQLKAEFNRRTDDSLFAKITTDGNVFFDKYSTGKLPNLLQLDVESLAQGQVRGPFYENGKYVLYKISAIEEDTVFAAKARHILFKWTDTSDEEKAKAKKEAEKILREIRNGADFAEMAKEHGTDGTAARGGDLGWGTQGSTWVSAFETPIFERTTAGLINNVIESEFGYHIIEVTTPKTNKAYKVATIEQEMIASETTREKIYRDADVFAYNSGNLDEFTANAEEGGLVVYTADKIDKNAIAVNNLGGAREIVRWAYNDASIGDVSTVFDLDNAYVVALLTGETDEGNAKLADVRNEILVKVKNELKTDYIKGKLDTSLSSLDEMASTYGADANVYSSSDLKFNSNSLPSVGYSPISVGVAFSLNVGEKSQPFATDNGVVIMELNNLTSAPEIADYANYKTQKQQNASSAASRNVMEAIKDFANIEDKRYKFY